MTTARDADAGSAGGLPTNAVLAERYEVEREIGHGGMATVYLARDRKHGRRVAIKVLRPEIGGVQGPERFAREIDIIAQLQHPNIVALYDSGEWRGRLYYVMPFVEGESLRQRLDREPRLTIQEVVDVARQIALALDYSHDHGVVHRDVKPENIMLTGGSVAVADFGIARALEAATSTRLTMTGLAVGTPVYMSPEQVDGSPAGAAGDQYSLACVVYEMLAGDAPFTGPSAQAIMRRHWLDPMPSVRATRADVPAAMERVLRRALDKDPARRWPTVGAFASALAASTTGGVALPRLSDLPRRRTLLVAGALLLVALLAAAAAVIVRARRGDATGETPLLVVLPFDHTGPAADKYIADGLTDEITTHIAGIRQLLTISSATARHYAGRPLRDVRSELHARYVLTGAIATERAPDGTVSLRVIPQLYDVTRPAEREEIALDQIRDTIAPGKTFDVQARVATSVAEALEMRLDADERRAVAAGVTTSPEAYGHYLRAATYSAFIFEERPTREAIGLYERAVRADPGFALAHAKLGELQSFYYYFFDRSPARLAAAKQAADRAFALDSTLAESRLALGAFYYWGNLDYDRAEQQFAYVARRQPNNPDLLWLLGSLARRRGRWDDALSYMQRAAQVNPRSRVLALELGVTYMYRREYAEAEREFQRCVALDPQWFGCYDQAAPVPLLWKADLAATRRLIRDAVARAGVQTVLESSLTVRGDGRWEMVTAGPALQPHLATLRLATTSVDSATFYLALGEWRLGEGDRAAARAAAERARAILERRLRDQPGSPDLRGSLGVAYALLGRHDEAVREATAGAQLVPPSRDAFRGPLYERTLLEVRLLLGDADEAIDLVRRQLGMRSMLSAASLAADPHFDALRADPRFQALVARDVTPTR